MDAPFPYFGGKKRIADIVWQKLGDVKHYIEPFAGSCAVLLNRPNYIPSKHVETINDKDCFIANVWRALQFNPDEVAKWADWPVNHADLNARREMLRNNEDYLHDKLIHDPEWYDAKLAGYWIWAASCWIGGGLTRKDSIPDISKSGKGIHRIGQRPHLGSGGVGIHRIGKRPHLSSGGEGVHKISLASSDGLSIDKHVQEPYNTNIYKWFRELSERLRYVRVVCGDWKRVCGGNWQDNLGICGMFFDPPYGVKDRDVNIYHHDGTDIAVEVKEWCRERGLNKRYRIVIAGYEEHEDLLQDGWTFYNWKAQGGYSNMGKKTKNNNNAREKLYFSPHCLSETQGEIIINE